MRVVVVSDTHAPRRWKAMPALLRAACERADAILHLGDVCVPGVLDELAELAPVHCVLGNNDGRDVAAWGAGVGETLELDLAGLSVAMIHDAGGKAGRAGRMRRRFPGASLVVFGHSHIPLDDDSGPVHLFNPGSPTDRRTQQFGTYGVLEIADGRLLELRICVLP